MSETKISTHQVVKRNGTEETTLDEIIASLQAQINGAWEEIKVLKKKIKALEDAR